MSEFRGSAITDDVALAAATAKTVVQIVAPANQRVTILGIGVFLNGVSTTGEPVEVKLVRQSDAGTMSSLTPTRDDDSLSETLQTTAQHTATVEPTTGDEIDGWKVHPQQGLNFLYPYGARKICGGGDRIGIICEAAAVVNVKAKIWFEE